MANGQRAKCPGSNTHGPRPCEFLSPSEITFHLGFAKKKRAPLQRHALSLRKNDRPCSGTRFARALFATAKLAKGHRLGQYAGALCAGDEKRTQPTREPALGQYGITLDMEELGDALLVDAKHVGNESRFINDYRGIAPKPNVAFITRHDVSKGLWVDVQVIELISEGDEILGDYGPEFANRF